MRVIGLQKQSLLDFPDKVSAIVFTPGCNFRCPFCHNFQIVLPESIAHSTTIDFDNLKGFFKERKALLDGVVFTGGEPALNLDLLDVMRELHSMGYAIKLDTNGTNPDVVKKALSEKLVDYIAMDIKTSLFFDKYNKAVGNVLTQDVFEKVKESIKLIMSSGINYEFRTTVVPGIVELDDIIAIANSIKGARKFCLQNFMPANAASPELRAIAPYSLKQIEKVKAIIKEKDLIDRIELRGFI